VTVLTPPRVLRDDQVRVWHSGLHQACGWLSISAIVDRDRELVAGDGEYLRTSDLKGAITVSITDRDTGEVTATLWRGGLGGMTPIDAHYFDNVTLSPGRYTLEFIVSKPDHAACTDRYDFAVPTD
jgi:uncharacterized protein involved in high-affinity Fe2+ transport